MSETLKKVLSVRDTKILDDAAQRKEVYSLSGAAGTALSIETIHYQHCRGQNQDDVQWRNYLKPVVISLFQLYLFQKQDTKSIESLYLCPSRSSPRCDPPLGHDPQFEQRWSALVEVVKADDFPSSSLRSVFPFELSCFWCECGHSQRFAGIFSALWFLRWDLHVCIDLDFFSESTCLNRTWVDTIRRPKGTILMNPDTLKYRHADRQTGRFTVSTGSKQEVIETVWSLSHTQIHKLLLYFLFAVVTLMHNSVLYMVKSRTDCTDDGDQVQTLLWY